MVMKEGEMDNSRKEVVPRFKVKKKTEWERLRALAKEKRYIANSYLDESIQLENKADILENQDKQMKREYGI